MGSPPGTIRAVPASCCFKLPDRQLEFSNHSARFVPTTFLQQSPIRPKRTLAPTCESGPDSFSDFAIVGKDGAPIVQLFRDRNRSGALVGNFQLMYGRFSAFPPRRP